ncbi:MAG: hypothetical protein MZV70_47010 [Desulfobacterales bacterium]|nr:hypothetical protein [Desulfobacterales bacterium]
MKYTTPPPPFMTYRGFPVSDRHRGRIPGRERIHGGRPKTDERPYCSTRAGWRCPRIRDSGAMPDPMS